MGTHQNRLDAKGRVSVPASFRTALKQFADGNDSAVVLRPSHLHPCIDAWPRSVFEGFTIPLQRLETFSETQEDLATALYADAATIDPDKEGRVVLPESLARHADLTDSVCFVGMGRHFQIWEPAAAQRRIDAARERARANAFTLPGLQGKSG